MLGGYVGLVDSHLWVPQEMPLGYSLATYHCLLLLLLLLISSEATVRRLWNFILGPFLLDEEKRILSAACLVVCLLFVAPFSRCLFSTFPSENIKIEDARRNHCLAKKGVHRLVAADRIVAIHFIWFMAGGLLLVKSSPIEVLFLLLPSTRR